LLNRLVRDCTLFGASKQTFGSKTFQVLVVMRTLPLPSTMSFPTWMKGIHASSEANGFRVSATNAAFSKKPLRGVVRCVRCEGGEEQGEGTRIWALVPPQA